MDTETTAMKYYSEEQVVALVGYAMNNGKQVPFPPPALSLPSGAGAEETIKEIVNVNIRKCNDTIGFVVLQPIIDLVIIPSIREYASLVALQKSKTVVNIDVKGLLQEYIPNASDEDGTDGYTVDVVIRIINDALSLQHQGKEKIRILSQEEIINIGAKYRVEKLKEKGDSSYEKECAVIGFLDGLHASNNYLSKLSAPPLAEKKGEGTASLDTLNEVVDKSKKQTIEFAEWVNKSGYVITNTIKNIWEKTLNVNEVGVTTEQLYDVFLSSNAGKEGEHDV